MRKKMVGILVIILFLGVALAPGITATVNLPDAASTRISENKELSNDLVEITVEVGNIDHKVMLTPDQAMELEILIDRTKGRLDTATTMEETSRIFDETVVSLYEMGMLPDGMSIREAQQLVKGHHHISKLTKVLKDLSSSNLVMLDDEENRLCLIAGHTDNNCILGLLPTIFEGIWFFVFLMFGFIVAPVYQLRQIFPLALGYSITYGYWYEGWMSGYWVSSNGWVYTNGLNGVKRWDGEFYGNISGELGELYGVRGFTGIKIKTGSSIVWPFAEYFYLGAALRVKMRYETPGV